MANIEHPDLGLFEEFVAICKREGLMQAECGYMKILLPPPAREIAKPGPENLNTGRNADGGPTPYSKLFPGGLPDFPKPASIGLGATPSPVNGASVVIDYDALP